MADIGVACWSCGVPLEPSERHEVEDSGSTVTCCTGCAAGEPFMSGVAGFGGPVTPVYVCSEPGCGAVFSDPEPDEAWGQYVEHQTGHDMDNDYITTAEVPD